MNVVLLTIDCLRADRLGCYGYSRPTSPALDRLASSGVRISGSFANSSCTSISFPAIITGTLPLSFGGPRYLRAERPHLPELLRKHGFQTFAVQTNSWLSYQANYPRGFDRYFEDYSVFDDTGSRLNAVASDFLIAAGVKEVEDLDENSRKRLIEAFDRALQGIMEGLNGASEHAGRGDAFDLAREDGAAFKKDPMAYIRAFVKSGTRLFPKKKESQASESAFSKILKKASNQAQRYMGHYRYSKKPYLDASAVASNAIRLIEQRDREKPFFLWTHFMDVHNPYLPGPSHAWPEQMGDWLKKTGHKAISPIDADRQVEEHRSALYDASIRYVDDEISRFVEFLQRKDIGPTLIAVTADHGEEFWEHGDNNHLAKLFDEVTHVPIFMAMLGTGDRLPSIGGDALMAHVDLLPTFAGLLHVPVPKTDGLNIFSGGRREIVDLETLESKAGAARGTRFQGGEDIFDYFVLGARGKDRKLIYYESEDRYYAFDLSKDPGEKNPVQADRSFQPLRDRLDQRLDQLKKDREAGDVSRPRYKSDQDKEQIESQLKALGYLE